MGWWGEDCGRGCVGCAGLWCGSGDGFGVGWWGEDGGRGCVGCAGLWFGSGEGGGVRTVGEEAEGCKVAVVSRSRRIFFILCAVVKPPFDAASLCFYLF